MEKFEFIGTPAPWERAYESEDRVDAEHDQPFNSKSVHIRYGNHSICHVMGINMDSGDLAAWVPIEVVDANANLICAAPLLLSALIKAVEQVDSVSMAASILNGNNIDTLPYELPYWYEEAKVAIQAAISQPENVKP